VKPHCSRKLQYAQFNLHGHRVKLPHQKECNWSFVLKKTTAIVTGAAGSLGSELSFKLAESGWNVVMLDKNLRGLEKAYDRIGEGAPGEALLHHLDLAEATPEVFEQLLDSVNGEMGGVDALVHCAAHFESLTPLEHIQPHEWLMSMQVNLNSPWLLSAMALPYLRDSGSGRLIYLLEDLGKVDGPLWGAYGVAKHALRALVQQMAAECRTGPLEVRGVNPGPMCSPIRTRVYHSENPADMPSAELAAARIASYLDGEEDWDQVLTDFTAG
jgi:NAD(P)-dependent dehydrogenase (short-subunit alcohol dehydrogenase family)